MWAVIMGIRIIWGVIMAIIWGVVMGMIWGVRADSCPHGRDRKP